MKKIPTLFVRLFDDNHNKTITTEITKGLEWVLDGEGTATLKIDGSCCCFINGKFYRRYDAKNGKTPPIGAIACCDPDPITGHWPHWIEIDAKDSSSKWYLEAYNNIDATAIKDGTYEAIGPHFKDNPYNLKKDVLVKHGEVILNVPRSFEGIKDYLEKNIIEGIVFWKDGEPKCKIKRTDFGFKWPIKNEVLMTKEEFKELIECGREIEFDYNGNRFSITYYNDNSLNYISFCEFNKEPIDVKSADELFRIIIDNISLEKIITNLPNSNFDIF